MGRLLQYITISLLCASCTLGSFGLSQASAETIDMAHIRLVSFNAQNLFDGVDNNQEYTGYTPPDWTNKEYEQRLVAIGNALRSIEEDPNIIALQEIEHEQVAADLQKYYLSHLPYVVATDNPDSATENVIISRYPIAQVLTHTIHEPYYKGNRYILEARLDIPFEKEHVRVQVLVVHLKSQRVSSGTLSSDEVRHKQYELLSKVEDTDMPTIIVGDFNDSNPLGTLNQDKDSFVSFPISTTHDSTTGTYYYRGAWSQLDHVLIDNYMDTLITDEQLILLDIPPFYSTKSKTPNSFIKRNRNFDAVSDHLPVLFLANFIVD